MSEQSKGEPETGSKLGQEGHRCHVREAKFSDVELLDAYSRAVETVVEAVAPAVVSIVVRIKSRDQAAGLSDGRDRFGCRHCSGRLCPHQ